MRMIPAIPFNTNSHAEKRVFDKLRTSFMDEQYNALVAFHSLSLMRHSKKRFGEIDFLICGPQGIFVLEVKGGRVSKKNDVWIYTDRNNKSHESHEGPFKQAESALHGLIKHLKENLPTGLVNQFTIGYGVVFPDCDFTIRSAEWDKNIFVDCHGFRNFELWLEKLFKYWTARDGRILKPQKDDLKVLRNFLRPEFEAVVPLHVQVSQTEDRVVTLTEDQMIMVDVMAANKRVLCEGGAGTGKTFLAMELARRLTAQNLNIVLVCRSSWLRRYLENKFQFPGLTISTIDSIKIARKRAGIQQFDVLIVDEGQDILDIECLDNLDSVLKGGLADGCWCFFCDINNQSGFFGKPDQEAINYLLSANPMLAPISTNCRNTQIILDKVKSSLGADMGVRGAGQGPKIREYTASNRVESTEILLKEIIEIINIGGISPGNVTILSPFPFKESSVVDLPQKYIDRITILDEYSFRNFPPDRINFGEISNFKGLENEAIIIIDLKSPDYAKDSLSLHYVAMSRARSVLRIIYQSDG